MVPSVLSSAECATWIAENIVGSLWAHTIGRGVRLIFFRWRRTMESDYGWVYLWNI